MRNRIGFDIVVLAAVFYAPWWGVAILAFIGAFAWPLYYEIIGFGLLLDVLYGAHTFSFGGISGILAAGVIYFIAVYAKKIVR